MPKRFQDETGHVFQYRAGMEGFAWGGMLLEADPVGRPPNRPQLLVNTRLSKGGYVGRHGVTSQDDLSGEVDPTTAFLSFVSDFQIPRPIKLWVVGDGCPGISASAGFFLGTYDQEQQPEFQRALYWNTATQGVHVSPYGGEVHIAVDASLRGLNLLPAVWGKENIEVSGVNQDRILHTFASPIACLREFDGYLFCGLNAGVGASSIHVWNGVSAIPDLTAINAPQCFGTYRLANGDETLVAGFAAAPNHVRSRVKGAPAGTWTTIVPGAGTVSARKMVRFRDVLYICGDGTTEIWSLTNATLAVARTVAGATMRSIAKHNGVLYYTYEQLVVGISHVFVGSYDGATWTDAVIDLTLTKTTLRQARTLESYRGILMLGGVTLASGAYLYGNVGSIASGAAWITIVPSANNAGDIDELVVI